MAKPEWGVKRICPSWGTRFYDLRRIPIVCPTCAVTVETESAPRSRRSRAAPVAAAEASAQSSPIAENAGLAVIKETAAADQNEKLPGMSEETDNRDIIEDASELGEDDDMQEVIDGVSEDEEEA